MVTLVDKMYQTGVKLSKQAMAELEKQIQRLPNLKKWFLDTLINNGKLQLSD